MTRILLLVPSLTDDALGDLGGRTPLETARTPGLDHLAKVAWFGRTSVVPAERSRRRVVGLPALLGYGPDPGVGRAALEAAGLGVPIGPDELVLRLDFVSTFRGTMADPRAGQLGDGEAALLLESLRKLSSPLPIRLHQGFSYRHLAVIAGAAEWELSTVPPHELLGQPLADFVPFGRDAADIVAYQEASRALLADHVVNRVRVDLGENPADAVWFWGEGHDAPLPPLQEVLGARGAMVASVPMLRGFAGKIGMSCPPFSERAAGDDDLRRRCALALSLAEDHELVVIHLPGALDASRARDAVGKVRALEAIDRVVISTLLRWQGVRPGHRLLITSDYSSSVTGQRAAAAETLFALLDSGPGTGTAAFDEVHARAADVERVPLDAVLARFHADRIG